MLVFTGEHIDRLRCNFLPCVAKSC